MTELSAMAGREGTPRRVSPPCGERDSNPFSAAACTSPKILRVPNECGSHSLGEEEQRND